MPATGLRLEVGRGRLDEERPRSSRGWKTAAELGALLWRGDPVVDRDTFYREARSALEEAALGHDEPDGAREAGRVAFLAVLCRRGLARRHVGLRPRERPVPLPVRRAPPSGAAPGNV